MDKPPTRRLPLRLLIVLAFCACGLAMHFAAENLGPLNSPFTFDLAQHAEQEPGEEVFVFPDLTRLFTDQLPVPPSSLRTARPASLPLSPQLPPPNS
jgi:hypothetical protein